MEQKKQVPSRGLDPPPDEWEKPKKPGDNDDDDDDDDDLSIYKDHTVYAVPLEKDPYNIIAIYGFTAAGFTAFLILIMKGAAVVFLYYDILLGLGDMQGNRFGVPPIVDWPVRGCQFISIPLTLVAHPDATIALYWLSIKYNNPGPAFATSSKLSWAISLWWRLLTGLLLAFASFVQINRAVRIRQLFLSIQAIMLIGIMDKVMFWLGEFGFLGKQLQEATAKLKRARILLPTERSARRYLKSLLLAILIGAGWLGWGTFFFFQSSGRILYSSSCSQLQVEMQDDWGQPIPLPADVRLNVTTTTTENGATTSTTNRVVTTNFGQFYFSWFSGTYIAGRVEQTYSNVFQTWELINERLVYYQVIDHDDSEDDLPPYDPRRGRFWYCQTDDQEVGQWVFTIDALTASIVRPREYDQDCPGWLLRSQPTEALRLEDVNPDSWLVWTAQGEVEEATGLNVDCEECETSLECNYNGICVVDEEEQHARGFCECNAEYTGPFCEVPLTCKSFVAQNNDDEIISFSPPLSEHQFYQITLGGQKVIPERQLPEGTAPTRASDVFSISNYPVYMELNNDRDDFTLLDAARANERVRFFFFASNRWYLSTNLASTVLSQLMDRTNVHPFWDQQYLQFIQAASSVSNDDTVDPPASPLDVGNNQEWLYVVPIDQGEAQGKKSAPIPIDLRLRCADAVIPIITCDPFFLPHDDVLGCPQEITGTPLPNSTIGQEAFDDNVETNVFSNESPLLVFEYPLNPTLAGITVAGYEIYPTQNDLSCKDPSSWTISGCTSANACTPLDTQTNQVFLSRTRPNRYLLGSFAEGPYRKLLFDFTNAGLCGDVVQVSEIKVYGYYNCGIGNIGAAVGGAPFLSPTLGCSFDVTGLIIPSGAANQARERPLLDDDLTTASQFDDGPTAVLDFEISAFATLAGYALATTVGPQVCESPKSWSLFVCTCSDVCTLVDTQSQVLTPNVRETFVFDSLPSTMALIDKVRLVVTNQNSNDCGVILSDFRLYATELGDSITCEAAAPTNPPTRRITDSPTFGASEINSEINSEMGSGSSTFDATGFSRRGTDDTPNEVFVV